MTQMKLHFCIALTVFAFQASLAVDPCPDRPHCYKRGITPYCRKWEQRCNGELCQQVCVHLDIPRKLSLALELQREIQMDLPLPYVQMIGSHNSYISPINGVGIEDERFTEMFNSTTSLQPAAVVIGNHRLTLTQQLDLGVRHLELDINQLPVVTGDRIRLCHWDVAPPIWIPWITYAYQHSGGSRGWLGPDWKFWWMGCYRGSNTFEDGLREVRQWLHGKPNEFVTLFLDNRAPADKVDQVMESLKTVFGTSLFQPSTLYKGEFSEFGQAGTWPSLRQLTNAGYHVMVENGDGHNAHAINPSADDTMWIARDAWSQFKPPSFTPYPACSVNGRPAHPVMNAKAVYVDEDEYYNTNAVDPLISLPADVLEMAIRKRDQDTTKEFGVDYNTLIAMQVDNNDLKPQKPVHRVTPQIQPVRTRAFEASLAFGPSPFFDEGMPQTGLTPLAIRQMTACGVSIISVDQMTVDLAKSFLWTFEDDISILEKGCTAMDAETGKWVKKPCDTMLPLLCRQSDSNFIYNGKQLVMTIATSPIHGVYSVDWNTLVSQDKSNMCGDGWEFTAPRTGYENTIARDTARMLRSAGAGQFIWLASIHSHMTI